ncbi:hypothetical protein ACIOU7_12405, partial [Pseudomonas fluorescens]
PDFQENDVIIMYINGSTLDGAPVAHDARQIITKEPPLVVSVFLPNSAARELAKTQAVFFYELERGGAVIQRSKSLFITIIGDPYHLAAPIADDAVNGALKPDLEQVSIRIPHDDRFEEDMGIELKWLGTQADLITYDPQLDLHILSAADASNPLGFIVKVDGVRHLKLLKGGTLDLSYNLLSDEDGVVVRRASQHAELLTVGEAQLELVPPIVQGEENGILEPRDLTDGTSKITCPNPLANPTKPQDVVTWLLRDAHGALLDEGSKTLNALTAGRPVDFPLDAAFVQKHFEARRGEKLSVSYNILRFETGKTSYSNPLVFTVGVALELLAPSIKENNGDSALNPLLVKDTLTAVVPDNPELRPTDEISVTWTGADGTPAGGSHTSVPRAVSEGLEFAIPNSVVAFNLGKQVKVSYVVIIDGHPTPSRVFDLTVQAMPQSALASPTIEQADNDGAGPELYTGDLTQASVRMGDWPLIALGQYVWLRLHGTNADGSAYVREIWSAPTAFTNDDWIANQFFTSDIAIAEIKNLQDGSNLALEFKAALGQSTVESEAVVFPVRTYTIKAALALVINTEPVSLGGWIFRSDHTPTNPPAGSFVDRQASGGVPPYQYSSSNSAAAEVNITNGRVISKGNGTAVITVRDSANQTVSYPVSVSNVYRIFGTSVFNTYTQCSNAAANQGGRIPSLAEWRSYISTYAGLTTESAWCWAADSAGTGKRWAIYPATGETKALRDLGFGGDTANGYGIR